MEVFAADLRQLVAGKGDGSISQMEKEWFMGLVKAAEAMAKAVARFRKAEVTPA